MSPRTEDDEDLPSLASLARDEAMDFAGNVAMAKFFLAERAYPEEGDPLEQVRDIGDSQFEAFLQKSIASYVPR